MAMVLGAAACSQPLRLSQWEHHALPLSERRGLLRRPLPDRNAPANVPGDSLFFNDLNAEEDRRFFSHRWNTDETRIGKCSCAWRFAE